MEPVAPYGLAWTDAALVHCHLGRDSNVVHDEAGILIQDPQDPNEIARRLDDILRDVPKREYMARNGRQRVYRDFLIFKQLCDWLSVLSTCAVAPPRMEGFRQVDG